MTLPGQVTPVFIRLAAHELRWRLLTELADSDYRVRELADLVGQPQNVVSYHLRLLRHGGLVTARRSSFDGRDSYYHLDVERCAHALAAAGAALHPALCPALSREPPTPPTGRSYRPVVLFACTGNSARSLIAEALLRHHAGEFVDTTSAGSHPKPKVHPNAVRALRERYGIDIGARRPRPLAELAGRRFDYVISLCDKVREVRPEFPDRPRLVHWSIPDPAVAGESDQDSQPAFRRAVTEIDTRIRHLLPVLATSTTMPPSG